MAEVPSSRRLVATARLIAGSIPAPQACRSALVAPLTDDPEPLVGMHDLTAAARPIATVDREAPAYLPRLFGPGSYAVLRRAHTLPHALVEVVRRLLHA